MEENNLSIDSGSPESDVTLLELNRTLGKRKIGEKNTRG